jgi:hypothetical protein
MPALTTCPEKPMMKCTKRCGEREREVGYIVYIKKVFGGRERERRVLISPVIIAGVVCSPC